MSDVTYPRDLVVVGTLSGLEPRNGGWMRFSISEAGKQYPVKCDTKKPELIEQAKALLGGQVTVKVKEQDSGNANPHQPGKNFINRYMDEIAAASPSDVPGEVAQPGQQQTQGQQRPAQQGGSTLTADQRRELRIMRQAASKNAVEMLSTLPESQQNMKGLVEVSEAWVAYFMYGAARFGVQPFNVTTPAQQQAAPPPEPEPEPEPVYDYTCPECGTHDMSAHKDGCSNDIPF